MVHRKAVAIVIVLFIIIAVLTIPVYMNFKQDMDTAREQLSAGSQVMTTASGPIEYADTGAGYPVLVVHGAGGGYDQGLILADMLLKNEFRVIAPSRSGFLQTPLSGNASITDQADAYADLLDDLNISRVAIVGISAGGPSTVEFGLRFPNRTSSMVLVSAVVHEEPPMNFMDKLVHSVLFRSDFLFWMIAEYFEPNLVSFFGVTPEVQSALTPEERAWLTNEIIPAMHPISQRQPGMVNDRTNSIFIDYQLDQVTVPTLVVYASDDTLVDPSHSAYAAEEIPGARVMMLEDGGHLLMGQHGAVRSEVSTFVGQNI